MQPRGDFTACESLAPTSIICVDSFMAIKVLGASTDALVVFALKFTRHQHHRDCRRARFRCARCARWNHTWLRESRPLTIRARDIGRHQSTSPVQRHPFFVGEFDRCTR